MNYDVIENSKADLRLSRRKALDLLPVLRKRDEGGRIVRIDPRQLKSSETDEDNEDKGGEDSHKRD